MGQPSGHCTRRRPGVLDTQGATVIDPPAILAWFTGPDLCHSTSLQDSDKSRERGFLWSCRKVVSNGHSTQGHQHETARLGDGRSDRNMRTR